MTLDATIRTCDSPATGKVRKAVEYGIPVRSKADFEGEFHIAET